MPLDYSQLLGPELATLLASLGSPVVAVQRIGRLASPASARAAFRVSLADGRELKARRLESARRCERLARIWPLLEDLPFSRGLAYAGASLLEPWIPGDPLTADRATPARLAEAGDMLGRLHSLMLPSKLSAGSPPLPPRLLLRLERRLGKLIRLGLVSSDDGKALLDEARRGLPQWLDTGVIHHDFCAENLIITARGSLCAIDNEDMRIGALDADLARCFLRWRMTASDRSVLLSGYGQHRSARQYQQHESFWSIWAVVGAAEFRACRGLPCEELLERLRCWTALCGR